MKFLANFFLFIAAICKRSFEKIIVFVASIIEKIIPKLSYRGLYSIIAIILTSIVTLPILIIGIICFVIGNIFKKI